MIRPLEAKNVNSSKTSIAALAATKITSPARLATFVVMVPTPEIQWEPQRFSKCLKSHIGFARNCTGWDYLAVLVTRCAIRFNWPLKTSVDVVNKTHLEVGRQLRPRQPSRLRSAPLQLRLRCPNLYLLQLLRLFPHLSSSLRQLCHRRLPPLQCLPLAPRPTPTTTLRVVPPTPASPPIKPAPVAPPPTPTAAVPAPRPTPTTTLRVVPPTPHTTTPASPSIKPAPIAPPPTPTAAVPAPRPTPTTTLTVVPPTPRTTTLTVVSPPTPPTGASEPSVWHCVDNKGKKKKCNMGMRQLRARA